MKFVFYSKSLPTKSFSLYYAVLLIPGYYSTVLAGTYFSFIGNVTGNLAEGLTFPNNTFTIAFPSSDLVL